ncbi:MAG TPA: sulfotransferase [Gammaproteobacteria bacterium]|nr:sulfotransferase [Gammaproteobacteria bacterium]
MRDNLRKPVAIGGLGGSGTRLIASILKETGFYLGEALNKPLDNLWFSLLFKRIETTRLTDAEFHTLAGIFLNAMTNRNEFSDGERTLIKSLSTENRNVFRKDWMQMSADSMLSVAEHPRTPDPRWGWKNPNTHMVIDRWISLLPNLKYIHVIRNGLDMAFSKNQNQLKLWGSYILGQDYISVTPGNSLKFWCALHRRLLNMLSFTKSNFYLLNYDDFCTNPESGLNRLCSFLGMHLPASQLTVLRGMVIPPRTIERYKQYELTQFDKIDVEFVRSLGFKVM